MGKIFDTTPSARKAIENAMARLDATKARKRKAATARRLELKRRRERERAEARRETATGSCRHLPNELRKRYAVAGWQVLLARMDPGVWYDWPQIRALMPEFKRGSVKAWVWQKAVRAGAIERAGNPDYKPDRRNPAATGLRYLYKISPNATGVAAEWRSALGMTSDTSEHENSAW